MRAVLLRMELFFCVKEEKLLRMSYFNVLSSAGAPNYHPNSFHGPVECKKALESTFQAAGDVTRYNSADDDNFTQPGDFWTKVL